MKLLNFWRDFLFSNDEKYDNIKKISLTDLCYQSISMIFRRCNRYHKTDNLPGKWKVFTMNSLIRVASISNHLELGNPQETTKQILTMIETVKNYSPDVYLFPAYALTGANLGNLSFHKTIIHACENCIELLLKQTRKLNAYLVIGGISIQQGKPASTIYVLSKGEIQATLTEEDMDYMFSIRGVKFHILSKPFSSLLQYVNRVNELGTDVTLIPTNNPTIAGEIPEYEQVLRVMSKATRSGIAIANGCSGDTSFPHLYRGITGHFECGKTLAFKQSIQGGNFTVTDFDSDIIRAEKNALGLPVCIDGFFDNDILQQVEPHKEILRMVSQDPYLPEDPEQKTDYLLDLFQLQCSSLATRLQHIHCEKVVVGVSGGLDSTLALLVCANAFTALNLPKSNIIAVTMQGFGTTNSTYENAISLMKLLGCTIREIPIKESVLQHFADIGHDPNQHDVTYENAQARERTQILLDLANQTQAIVVGTGDLSEEALGFATFAGDHIANFNVNTCITKSMIRSLIVVLAQTGRFKNCAGILTEILNTPVSPELLPPSEQGKTTQKTEEILGPYLLHDFFLYYFVKYHFSPKKLFYYAQKAFKGQFEDAYLKEKLAVFLKRFCAAQFKRSCTPDSSVITEVNLSNTTFFMPSDMSADLFLQELEKLN